MDARELGFSDASFDHVLAPYVISVVPEPHRVMSEIRRVCRPGGTVIVVNHFRASAPLLRLVEHALTPATQWIGFRMDLPVEVVTGQPGLEVLAVERVNLLRLWRLIVMRRSPGPIPVRP
jgi:phosphatidylethanolamine/phosphatidyl-N-methylethanolamine N-methyltransferase